MRIKFITIFLACIIYSSSLYSESFKPKLTIATIVTDKTLATNKTLRTEYLGTFNQYSFLKHKSLFSSDIKKARYGKKGVITTNDAFKVASNIKADFVIIFDVITTITNILITNTNTLSTNTNTSAIRPNNYFGIITNRLDAFTNTNTFTNTNSSTNTNTNAQTLITNTSCTLEVFEPSTGATMRFEKYENVSTTRENLNNIAKSFESYLADKILESITPPENNISIDFSIERRNIEGKIDKLNIGDKLYNGDSLKLNYEVNRGGYLYIMLIQAAGPIVLLYPNEFNTNFITNQTPIEANKKYSIPDNKDIFRLNISESQGKDRLYIIYTSRQQKWFDTDFSGVGFKLSQANSLINKMNAIKKSLNFLGNNNYQVITFEFEYYEEPKVEDEKTDTKEEEKEKIPLDKAVVLK